VISAVNSDGAQKGSTRIGSNYQNIRTTSSNDENFGETSSRNLHQNPKGASYQILGIHYLAPHPHPYWIRRKHLRPKPSDTKTLLLRSNLIFSIHYKCRSGQAITSQIHSLSILSCCSQDASRNDTLSHHTSEISNTKPRLDFRLSFNDRWPRASSSFKSSLLSPRIRP